METDLMGKTQLPKMTFKSYYVVWKLLCQDYVLPKTYLFKSYYVVWKLFLHQKATISCCCLNRTM